MWKLAGRMYCNRRHPPFRGAKGPWDATVPLTHFRMHPTPAATLDAPSTNPHASIQLTRILRTDHPLPCSTPRLMYVGIQTVAHDPENPNVASARRQRHPL